MPTRPKKPCAFSRCSKLISLDKEFCNEHTNKTKIIVVAGPAGSGKTTYVKDNMDEGDLIVDFDDIFKAISNLEYYNKPEELLPFAWEARDAVINKLRRNNEINKAWIIGTFPKAEQRNEFRYIFDDVEVLVIKPEKKIIKQRIMDDNRRKDKEKHISLMQEWFDNYTPDRKDKIKGG